MSLFRKTYRSIRILGSLFNDNTQKFPQVRGKLRMSMVMKKPRQAKIRSIFFLAVCQDCGDRVMIRRIPSLEMSPVNLGGKNAEVRTAQKPVDPIADQPAVPCRKGAFFLGSLRFRNPKSINQVASHQRLIGFAAFPRIEVTGNYHPRSVSQVADPFLDDLGGFFPRDFSSVIKMRIQKNKFLAACFSIRQMN